MPSLSPFFLLVHIIVTLSLALLIINRRINVSTTLSWIILLSVLPFVGPVIYFLFGSQSLGRKRLKAGWSIRQHYQRDTGTSSRATRRLPIPKSR